MNKSIIAASALALILSFTSCDDNTSGISESVLKNREMQITSNVLSTNFVGNGAQWGGYDLVKEWLNIETLSDADWNTLFDRIDFMRPPFLRIMTSAGWAYDNGGTYDVTSKTQSLFKMLEYAQSRNIEIAYGEWGHQFLNNDIAQIDPVWVKNSVKFLDYLVNTKGFTCIKTVNIINEPNGDWATTNERYDVYKAVQLAYVEEMKSYSLANIALIGPDIAVFNETDEMAWIANASRDLGEYFGLYDLHVYPKQTVVRDGDYIDILKFYRKAVPANKRIVLGEIGFKYEDVDAELRDANLSAIEADPFAGDDSNMMVYHSFYGVDMADAMIQAMCAGYSGSLVWGMDDAMYNDPGKGANYNFVAKKLKRWGFWNILGNELCNTPEDENIRPHFYPISLLTRFFPAGSDIYEISLADKKGVRAIMAEKDGKHTIAIVNSHYVTYELKLKSDFLKSVTVDKYVYKALDGAEFEGPVDARGLAIPTQRVKTLDLESGIDFSLEGESFVLYTNMD